VIRNRIILGAVLLAAVSGLPVSAATTARPRAAVHIGVPPEAEANARLIHVASAGSASSSQRITLSLNKAAIVELDSEAHDVLVSSPDIVDAVVRSPRRIFLLGTKSGQTNAFFFDAAGRQILSLDIRVEKDVTDLSSMMKTNLPNSAITVQAMNDNVVLTGQVASAMEATRATDLAASFAGDPKKVVNMLQVSGGEQVMLKVRMAEMDRNIAKQFGVNLAGTMSINGTPIVAASQNPYGLLGRALSDITGAQVGGVCGATPLPTGVSYPCNNANSAQGVLQALEQVGLVHILAEPDLTAVSGETAKFLAGGEFPVPSGKDQQGNVTLEFKQFGVGLSFTPVVLGPGRISLQMSTEVSELTNTGAFQLQGGSATVNGVTTVTQGVTVPALSVRRAQTTIELPSGGSFAIAGLMQHETKQVIDGFPGLKDMPVLGALFRSRDFQNNETELVVLVSAYLVQPTAAAALTTPTEGFVPPSDPETLLLGRLNAVYKKSATPLTPQAAAPVGYVVR
jgi:pilus assembly protein CpaC